VSSFALMVRVVAVVVAMMRCARRDAVRALAGIGPAAIGRPGPSEGVGKCRDRATATLEDIWCEKIRGCSYRATRLLRKRVVMVEIRCFLLSIR
jgi:hypothetical protein